MDGSEATVTVDTLASQIKSPDRDQELAMFPLTDNQHPPEPFVSTPASDPADGLKPGEGRSAQANYSNGTGHVEHAAPRQGALGDPLYLGVRQQRQIALSKRR